MKQIAHPRITIPGLTRGTRFTWISCKWDRVPRARYVSANGVRLIRYSKHEEGSLVDNSFCNIFKKVFQKSNKYFHANLQQSNSPDNVKFAQICRYDISFAYMSGVGGSRTVTGQLAHLDFPPRTICPENSYLEQFQILER